MQGNNVPSGQEYRDISAMNRKFKKAFRFLDEVEVLTEERTGMGVFSKYEYSKDSLINSKHLSMVEAMIDSIDDDVANWVDRGNISATLYEEFKNNAKTLESRYNEVLLKIRKRPSNGIDRFLDSFTVIGETIGKLIGKIPLLGGLLRGVGGFIAGLGGAKMIDDPRREQKRLPSPEI